MLLSRSSRCIPSQLLKSALLNEIKLKSACLSTFHTLSSIKIMHQPYYKHTSNIVRLKHSKKKKEQKLKQKQSSTPKIEVTQTSASHLPPIIKPSDQIAEEEIRDLQAEIAFHHKHAQYQEALQTSQTLLQKSLDHFERNHPVTASSYNNIGLMHKYLGEFADAREMYHEALAIYGETVGTDHASYAATLNNMGNLLRAQTMLEDQENMSALQRLQLNEMAVEYFEQSLKIRTEELGPKHPHTVTSHSNLGAAMASMLLQEQANRIHVATKQKNNKRDDLSQTKSPLKTSKLTQTRWEAAEQHLRTALNTAVQHPRGKTYERLSSSKTPSFSFSMQIQTLSGAGAAQNLAVFIKSKADILQESSSLSKDTNSTTTSTTANTIEIEDMYSEARNLYQEALHIRSIGLSDSHPDTIATKFSLAELYAVAYHDEKKANQLRQEILDAYSVEERDAVKK